MLQWLWRKRTMQGSCPRRKAHLNNGRTTKLKCSPAFNIELKRISPRAPDCCSGSAYEGKSKLAVLMGDEFFTKIAGAEAGEMAGRGAQRVIGIDIREDLLQAARQKALSTVSKILVSSYLRRRSLRTSSFPWTPLSISPTLRESCVS